VRILLLNGVTPETVAGAPPRTRFRLGQNYPLQKG